MTAGTQQARQVWDDLVGQRPVITGLQRAAGGDGMTHAWLFTGPPGSGRSNAAIAFAAALQCETGTGCGDCKSCHTVMAGSHADVRIVRTEKLSIGVDEVRDLVRMAGLAPSGDRWQIMIVEDADRLTEPGLQRAAQGDRGADGPHRLAALRAHRRGRAADDPLALPPGHPEHPDRPTRSRRSWSAPSGSSPELAASAARASQGHIGRARALARDEETRNRRREVVPIPARLTSLGACMPAATNVGEIAKDEAEAITTELDAREKNDLDAAYGVVERGRRPREYAPALSALEKDQKTRAKRRILDVVDRGLMDLVSVYRDAIAAAVGAPGALVNEEMRGDIEQLTRQTTPEELLRMIDAIFNAREQMLEFNVPPLLALESMMVALRLPGGAWPVKKILVWVVVVALMAGTARGCRVGVRELPGRPVAVPRSEVDARA